METMDGRTPGQPVNTVEGFRILALDFLLMYYCDRQDNDNMLKIKNLKHSSVGFELASSAHILSMITPEHTPHPPKKVKVKPTVK